MGVYKSDEISEMLSGWWGVVLGKVFLTIFRIGSFSGPPISSSSSLWGPLLPPLNQVQESAPSWSCAGKIFMFVPNHVGRSS